MSEREAADRLNLMPNYVAILERDDYQALRSPPFARGYVKAYGRLLGLDERQLMSVFDALNVAEPAQQEKRMDDQAFAIAAHGSWCGNWSGCIAGTGSGALVVGKGLGWPVLAVAK